MDMILYNIYLNFFLNMPLNNIRYNKLFCGILKQIIFYSHCKKKIRINFHDNAN